MNLKSLYSLAIISLLISINAFSLSLENDNTNSVTLLYNTHAFDPAGADNDGLAEGGESIVMPVNIFNSGTTTATGVSATISTSDTDITITDASKNYNDIFSDGNEWSIGGFAFDIDADCIEHDVEFILEISSAEGNWTSPFLVHIYPENIPVVPFLLYNTHAFNPAGADNDGLAEGGESIIMPVDIYNSGTAIATNVSAVLSTSDADITITDANKNYNDIITDGNEWSIGGFAYDINADCIEHDVEFILNMTSDEGTWESTFLVHIYPENITVVPFLLYNTHAFDPAGADNDGLAEGGESIIMPVNIFNSGTAAATNVSAVLSTSDTDITITDASKNYNDVFSDGNEWSQGGFAYDIDIDCIEHDVEFILNMTSDEGNWTSTFLVHIYPENVPVIPFLLYNSHAFNPAGADNDGLAEGGESIIMPVNIFNSGTETASNVSAILSTTDADITITDASTNFNNIASDGNQWSIGGFAFDIDADCMEHDVEFLLNMTSNEGTWTSTFLVHIYPENIPVVPFLLYNTHIYDPAGADDDGLPEGGESITMPVNIFNSGNATATNVIVTISTLDSDITFSDNQNNYPDIQSDSSKWSIGGFIFDIAEGITEHDVEFILEINSDEGNWTSAFMLRVYPANTPPTPYLIYNTHAFSPAGDDDDGLAEGGESIIMPVSIFNSGTATATNVSAIITCTNPLITITDVSKNYPVIQSDSARWSIGGFGFDIGDDVEEQDVLFSLEISSDEGNWSNHFLVHILPANVPVEPFLLYNTHIFTPAGADDDGLAEGGESIIMPINIFNSGTDTATNVSASISCIDPDITITDNTKTYNDILTDSAMWSNGGYGFDIAEGIDEHDVEFVLELNSDEGTWTSVFTVRVYPAGTPPVPFLLFNTYMFNPAGDDDDGLAEGGESIIMPVNLFNSGTDTATNVRAVLTCLDPDITITESLKTYIDILSDSAIWSDGGFSYYIAENALEHDVEFNLEMTADQGVWTSSFVIRVFAANVYTSPTLIYNTHAYNPAGEDHDIYPEGGESIGLRVNIYNSGKSISTNITALVSCLDPDIVITDNNAIFIDLLPDSTGWSMDGFEFNIDINALEHDVEFIIEMTSEEGVWMSPFLVHIYPADAPILPNLVYNTHIFTPAGADNDGIAEGGESIIMPVELFNSGYIAATNITAILSCLDSDITITENTISYPDISIDSSRFGEQGFHFDINSETSERDVEFILNISSDEGDWLSPFLVHIYAANAIDELHQIVNIAYPNPNNGVFILQASDMNGYYDYYLLDIAGNRIKQGALVFSKNQKNRMDFSYLSAGIYFLKMTKDSETKTQKIIIQ